MMPEHDAPGIVRVHVENMPEIPRPEKKVAPRTHSTFGTFTVVAAAAGVTAAMLLGEAPNRKSATLFLSGGNAGDTVMLCGDQGSASQGIGGATIPVNAFPVPIQGADDVWISVPAGKTVTVGVIAVYGD